MSIDEPRTSRKDGDDRYYEWPKRGSLPSITTLLSRLPAMWLAQWQARIVAEEAANYISVTLDEAEEKYRNALTTILDGEEMPTFTIDRGIFANNEKAVNQLKGVPNRRRDDAAMIGTLAHSAVRNYLEFGTEPDMLDSGYVDAAKKFLWEKGLQPRRFEQELANFDLGYAGTADLLCRNQEDELIVVDWKTGNRIYPKHAAQIVALMNCTHYLTKEMGSADLPHCSGGFIVHLTEAGGFTPYRIKLDHAALMMQTMIGLMSVMQFSELKSSDLWVCN